MKNFTRLNKQFAFTRAQRLGVISWSAIIFVLLVCLNFYGTDLPESPVQISESDVAFLAFNSSPADHKEDPLFTESTSSQWQAVYFNFDPNTIGQKEWVDLGFSEKQAETILNYRKKIGGFKKKEDLKNVFVISEKKYAELEPYIQISGQPDFDGKVQMISLNTATKEELIDLPGIGDFFAERIIKYRNSLGGFTSLTQLHEVYGMKEDIYQVLVENTTLETGSIRQLKINSASKDEIDKHPYIDFDVTAAILKERELKKIESLNFLLEKNLLTQDELNELIPYIDFE